MMNKYIVDGRGWSGTETAVEHVVRVCLSSRRLLRKVQTCDAILLWAKMEIIVGEMNNFR